MLIKMKDNIPCVAAMLSKRAKIIPTVRALETTEYLGKERAYIPWKSAMNNLEYFDLMFDRSEIYGPLQVSSIKEMSFSILTYHPIC